MRAQEKARSAESSARHSDTLAWTVRGGLVGYGALHLLVAWVAVRLALTPESGHATGKGALAELARDGSGRLVLGVMAVGFAGLMVWQLVAGTIGYRDREGWSRAWNRFAALCRAVLWVYLAVTTAMLALAGGSAAQGSPDSSTARLMSWPAGPWLVAVVGGVSFGIGIGLAIFGWRVGFLDQLDDTARADDGRRVPIVVVGRVGYVAKGIALMVIGVLLWWAAWTHDPRKSGGLDRSLRELLGAGLGKAAIVVVAVGLACYGLFLIARARHLNRDTLTS